VKFIWDFFKKERKLGYLFDPPDHRDLLFTENFQASPTPESATTRVVGIEPRDQGGTNSCVGYACSTALRIALSKDGFTKPDLSAFFTYYNARRMSGSVVVDTGTYIRDAIKATQKFGICSENVWEPNPWKVNRQPSWRAYRHGYDYKGIRGYYRVTSPEEVRSAIAKGKPVIGGWAIDSGFCESSGPSVVDVIQQNFIGNHAMLIESYGADGNFTLHNSWGTSWRNHGRVKVTENFIGRMVDGWAIDT
jgi:hypothetical protein